MRNFSIIITTQNQAEALRERLPLYLNQELKGGKFEVVVVDIDSKDDTNEVLEHLMAHYPNLHVTKVPATARDISIERLVLTLGIRAASWDDCIITSIDCWPNDEQWLQNFTSLWHEDKDIILGMTVREKRSGMRTFMEVKRENWRRDILKRLAQRGHPYRPLSPLVGYRRTKFMEHHGFASNTLINCGAMDIMVNQYANVQNSLLCESPDAMLTQACPTSEYEWSKIRLFDVEIRHHLLRRWRHRGWYFLKLCYTWPLGALVLPLWDAKDWLRWKTTNKKTFRKKFV